MAFTIFEQPCKTCGKPNLGPREGGRARGRWLGYDDCHDCRHPDPVPTSKQEAA